MTTLQDKEGEDIATHCNNMFTENDNAGKEKQNKERYSTQRNHLRNYDVAGKKVENDDDASYYSSNTAAEQSPHLMNPGIWKYSKTRQVAFWMKQSIRNVVSHDFQAAYRKDRRDVGNRQSVSTSSSSTPSNSLRFPLQCDTRQLDSTSGNTAVLNQKSSTGDCDNDVYDFDYKEYCENIDQAMLCLGQEPTLLSNIGYSINRGAEYDGGSGFTSEHDMSCILQQDTWHPYDWLLDGDPISHEPLYNDNHDNVNSDECERASVEEQTMNGGRFNLDGCKNTCDKDKETLEKVLAGLELEDESNEEMNGDDAVLKEDNMFVKVNESELDDDDIQRDGFVAPLEVVAKQNKTKRVENCLGLRDMSKCWTESTDWIEKWDPLPDFLPFEDPSTPEGVFVRCWQKERDRLQFHGGTGGNQSTTSCQDLVDIDSCCNVPSYHMYCDENHDTFLDILTGVPWDDLMQDNGHGDISAIDQDVYLIEILSSLDELSRDVSHELLSKVKQKETDIHDEMTRVQAVHRDVACALSDLTEATALLQRARGATDEKHGGSRDGLIGGLYIIEDSESRSRLRELNNLLLLVEEMVEMEASISEVVEQFSVDLLSDGSSITAFLETCENVKNRLFDDDQFRRLRCLDEARERIGSVFDTLCQRIEEELSRRLFETCKRSVRNQETSDHGIKTILSEYSHLFEARLLLEENRIKPATKCDGEDNTQFSQTVHDITSTWPLCIYKSLCFEADRCLPRALLDPTRVDGWIDTSTSDFDSNLTEIKTKVEEIQYFGQDAASIQSLTSNLLTIRLEFDKVDLNTIVGIFHALCSSLADVMHSYNVLTQWHREKIETVTNACADSRSCTPINDSQSSRALHITNVDDTVTKEDYTKSTSSSNYSQSSESSRHTEYHHEHFNAIPQCVSTPKNSNLEVDLLPCKTSARLDRDILDELLRIRCDLWLHCKGVIVKFLNAIISSQDKKEKDNWSVTWLQDLESLHDIFRLSDQIHTLGREFRSDYETNCFQPLCEGNDVQCDMKDALTKLFLGYLRGAHVESMTEIGTMIASETWDLLPFSISRSDGCDDMSKIYSSIQCYITEVRRSLNSMSKPRVYQQLLSSQAEKSSSENSCMRCDIITHEGDSKVVSNASSCDWPPNSVNSCRCELYKKVELFFSKSSDEIILASKTALNGLARWTVRLQAIQVKLPLISDQVVSIVCNLYDLYFLTIFRLCVRDGRSEAIILGNTNRSDHNFHERFPRDVPPPQSRSGNLRQKVLNRMDSSHLVSNFCDADINAPLDSEEETIIKIKKFVSRGQQSLSSMVNLDRIETWSVLHEDKSREEDDVVYSAKCMEKLIAASSSALFVACLFEGCVSDMISNFDSPLRKYYEDMIGAICGIHEICIRMCGTRTIMAERVVSNIVSLGNAWSELIIMEHCNSYIEDLSDRYVKLWHHLSSSSLAPFDRLLSDIWDRVVESGFLALLEGFSKIYHCSTEGRALMSIDLASFAQNITPRAIRERFAEMCNDEENLLPPPPYVTPSRGKHYVDTYIKVFYFPLEDAIKWIQQNRTLYHMSHLLALVSIGAHDQLPPQTLAQYLTRREEIKRLNSDGSTTTMK